MIIKTAIQPDEWEALKSFTDARIALGSTGVSVPLKEALRLRMAHAHAKDAVYSQLDVNLLTQAFEASGHVVHQVDSNAKDRDVYLQRPDLGRRLNEASTNFLQQLQHAPADISIVIADGLSASAVNENAIDTVMLLLGVAAKKGFTVAPIILTNQGRVAIADEIGSLLRARLTIIFIGERPGLSSFNSMGAYITYGPSVGNTDEKRNCVSNIRALGLRPELAAEKIIYLIVPAFKLGLTGIALKDGSTQNEQTEQLVDA